MSAPIVPKTPSFQPIFSWLETVVLACTVPVLIALPLRIRYKLSIDIGVFAIIFLYKSGLIKKCAKYITDTPPHQLRRHYFSLGGYVLTFLILPMGLIMGAGAYTGVLPWLNDFSVIVRSDEGNLVEDPMVFQEKSGDQCATYVTWPSVGGEFHLENLHRTLYSIFALTWDGKDLHLAKSELNAASTYYPLHIDLPSQKIEIKLHGRFTFDPDKYNIDPTDDNKAGDLAVALRTPETCLVILAYADKMGSGESNLTLSENRGLAVARAIHLYNPSAKISVILAAGCYHLVEIDGHATQDLAANRSVDALVISKLQLETVFSSSL